eukprot:Clim_evm6s13 gene=Clim_evmTU6s13
MRKHQMSEEERLQIAKEREEWMKEHEGHELMHFEIFLVMLGTLAGVQIALFLWRKYRPKTYQLFTTFCMWAFPIYFAFQLELWRMIELWGAYTILSAYVYYRARENPLQMGTPRLIYKWFSIAYKFTYLLAMGSYFACLMGFLSNGAMDGPWFQFFATLLFYGLYFGMLTRDFAEIITTTIASRLGYGGTDQMPKRVMVDDKTCAVCGQELVGGEGEEELFERKITLECGHRFHEFCIRGWTVVGKKETCPYCKEKVQLKTMFPNNWEKPDLFYLQMLEVLRYLVVWQPLILITMNVIVRFLDLK